jgi:signal transduction histidine kinase
MKPLSTVPGYEYVSDHPLPFATAAMIALVAISMLVGPLPFRSPTAIALCLVLPFWMAFIRDRGGARLGLAVLVIGLVPAFGFSPAPAAVACIVWLGGRFVHDRNQLARELGITNRELALERQAHERAQVLAERARVARELHDVLGHSLTVVVLQAGASRRMWELDHARAIAALAAIDDVVSEGMVELLAALGSIQTPTNDLSALIDGARRAGLRVDVTFDPAAPIIGLAAYRVVQEGLTNALKHAPDRRVRVRVDSCDGYMELEIVNRMRTLHGSEPGSPGQGLQGMRQRVEGCGGTLDWGRSSNGEFAVRARLPS